MSVAALPLIFSRSLRYLGVEPLVTSKLHLMLHLNVTGRGFLCPFVAESRSTRITSENEKTLEIIEKTRVFDSEVDGGRTRNLRIDSPVL